METFTWAVRIEPVGDVGFAVAEAVFGDGYSQQAAEGINNVTEAWQVSIRGMAEKISAVDTFLRRHGGFKRFLWTPPGGVEGVYLAKAFQKTPHNSLGVATITVKFELKGMP